MKKYQLKTLAEILDIIEDRNIDCFLEDFSEWLRFSLGIKKLADLKAVSIKDKNYGILLWNDDNKPGIKSIKIEVKDPQDRS